MFSRLAAAALCLAALLGAPLGAGEATPSVAEIVRKANHMAYYQGKDGRASVHMTITDAQGRSRERDFIILRRNVQEDGEQRFYVYFNSPADVRRMVYMVWKHLDRDDDRWLYVPNLDLVRPIAPGDKRTSFAGSHFVYEDVSGRRTTDDTHQLVEATDKHFVLKNVPKDPRSVEFAHYTMWIDRKTYMPLRAEYYDRSGRKYRIVEALTVEPIQGFPTVTKSRVQDLASGGNTVSVFSNIRYNIGLPEDVFTQRYLRRAPRRWLR